MRCLLSRVLLSVLHVPGCWDYGGRAEMSPVNCQSEIDKERCRESIVLHEVGSGMEENVLFFPEPETQLSRPHCKKGP